MFLNKKEKHIINRFVISKVSFCSSFFFSLFSTRNSLISLSVTERVFVCLLLKHFFFLFSIECGRAARIQKRSERFGCCCCCWFAHLFSVASLLYKCYKSPRSICCELCVVPFCGAMAR